ncbi:hypothetical protein SGPA1_30442 [Streptomyces misionensis JCM 4497]
MNPDIMGERQAFLWAPSPGRGPQVR